MKKFANDKLKGREKLIVEQFSSMMHNIRLALISSKTYEDLCKIVGFLDAFLSEEKFPAISQEMKSLSRASATSQDLLKSGETILWEYLGGIPQSKNPEYVSKVMVDACKKKGYNPTSLEDAYNLEAMESANHTSVTSEVSSEVISELEQESPDDLIGSSNGVVKQSYGPFDVYIAFRETDKSTNRSRYRVYIPSLSILIGSLGGFTFWTETFGGERRIWKEFYLGGKTKQYLRKQWFPHLSLFCPAIIGDIPLSHNTAVELSFKIKKHHTELGALARQRPGGMNLVEYVKRAGVHMRREAVRVIALLRDASKNREDPRKRAASQRQSLKNRTVKKLKISFDQLASNSNPVYANEVLVPGVFKKKGEDIGKETIPSESVQRGAPHVINVPSNSLDATPLTQQSQQVISTAEEAWEKRGRGRDEGSDKAFAECMCKTKEKFFGDWPLRRIAQFLTRAYLEKRDLKIDCSALSRIFNKGKLPGAGKCSVLKHICNVEIPSRTLEDENLEVGFEFVPGAESLLSRFLSSAEQGGSDTDPGERVIAKFGDASFRNSDLKRLVRPEAFSGPQSRYWISDECVNILTSFFSKLRSTSRIYYFNSLFVESVLNLLKRHCSQSGKSDSESLQRLIAGQEKTRNGQARSFSESDKGFAPCLVSKSHWIGFRIDKSTLTVQGVDSGSPLTGKEEGAQLTDMLSRLDGQKWKFLGMDEGFPRQKNDMDCGVLMLIAARNWNLGLPMIPAYAETENTTLWRKKFAHEILVSRVT